MRRVAVVSRAGGGGERGWGGGVGHIIVVMKGLRARTHMNAHRLMHGQCWLQMLEKSTWRATMSIKHEFARRVSVTRRGREHANDPLAS